MTLAGALWWAVVAAEACGLAGAVVHDRPPESKEPHSKGLRGGLTFVVRAARRPLVPLLAYALAADVAMALVELHLAGLPRPFAGTARALYHLHTALGLGWPAALAAAAWRAFDGPRQETFTERVARVRGRGKRPPAPLPPWQVVFTVWASWVVTMMALHPMGRVETAGCLRLAQAVGIGACVWAGARFWGRTWSRAAACVVVLVAVELALAFLGPWARDVFRDWDRLARGPYAIAFATVAALLWTGRVRFPGRG